MGRIIRGQRKGAGSIFTSNTSKRKGAAKHRQSVSEIYSRGVTYGPLSARVWEGDRAPGVKKAWCFTFIAGKNPGTAEKKNPSGWGSRVGAFRHARLSGA